MNRMIDLKHGDCLELMKDIPDGSIDMILCDLPYGTMKNAKKGTNLYKKNEFIWDNRIKPHELFAVAEKVLRPNGKMVLFAQEPYTSELILNAIPSIPFSYKAIWKKSVAGHPLGAKKNMMSYFEDICIFSKIAPKSDFDYSHPLRAYNKKVFNYIGITQKEMTAILGTTYNSHYWTDGVQFSKITKKDYEIFENKFGLEKMEGYLTYSQMEQIDKEFKQEHFAKMNEKYPAVFNLWENKKSKSNVLEYSKDRDGYHPTQKPVLLLEDLVKTYTNAGDTVLDNCMGSGSTGVACVNTGRNFIGIELDENYFEIAKQRIKEAAFSVSEEVGCV